MKPRPSIKKIQAAWKGKEPTEWAHDPDPCCWSCGKNDTPERAHIVAESLGGSADPLNFLLLCSRCHREQPDTAPREAQMLWIRRRVSYLDYLSGVIYPIAKAGCDMGVTSEQWNAVGWPTEVAGQHSGNMVANAMWGRMLAASKVKL